MAETRVCVQPGVGPEPANGVEQGVTSNGQRLEFQNRISRLGNGGQVGSGAIIIARTVREEDTHTV